MAINITVYPQYSPRIIEILAPTTNASLQEIIDACREWEDSTIGQYYPYLIDASGKEDLGGGVNVGITAQLQNAQVLFSQSNIVVSTGTVTSSSTEGSLVTFTDSGATFQTDGVVRGDTIWNTTDGSRSTVMEVKSQTEIAALPLGGGTDNTFQASDAYKIWQEIECNISGGNLVAIDDLGAGINAVTSSAGVFVETTSASSATLTQQDIIDQMSLLVTELHKIQGLDAANPMVVTQTTRTADNITLDITGDKTTITTVTRQ